MNEEAIGAHHANVSHRSNTQGPHRVYETRSNKSLGILNPHALAGGARGRATHFEPSLLGGRAGHFQNNKTQDAKQSNGSLAF